MKNKAFILNLIGAVAFLIWAGVGLHVVEAWFYGTPPGGWTAAAAAFACLGFACEAMNRAWSHADRARTAMRIDARP